MSRSEELQDRILRELTSPGPFQWNFRISYANIAERLSLNPETVRLTLNRVRDAGLVRNWRLLINPHLIDRELATLELDVNHTDGKTAKLPEIFQIDGVVLVFNFHGAGLRVVFYYEDERSLERKIRLLSLICSSREGAAISWKSSIPHCDMRLRGIDWKILRTIRRDPYRQVSEIAAQIHTSKRTVNRRLRMMAESKVAFLVPIRSIRKSRGTTCAFVILGRAGDEESIDNIIQSGTGRVAFKHRVSSDLLIVTIVFENISEGEEVGKRIEQVDGIKRVRMSLMKEFFPVDEWIDGVIDHQCSAAAGIIR